MAAFANPFNDSRGNGNGNGHSPNSGAGPDGSFNGSGYPVLLDEIFNNLTNREEILRRWSEKLRVEREEHERVLLIQGSDENSTSAIVTESSLLFSPDSVWPVLWIALYIVVLIVIIVVTIKACILLFEKTDDSKFEDSKDSPNILRMAVAGRNSLTRTAGASVAVTCPAPALLEHQRSISPRSVILQQPSPNSTSTSTRPCFIYNAGHAAGAYNYNTAGCGLPGSAGGSSSGGSCSWSHHFMGAAGCCSKATGVSNGKARLLRTSGRGVSLESELMMTPCGNYYLHHNIHNPHSTSTKIAVPPHHHSQQQLCTAMTMNVTPPTAIPVAGGSGSGTASRRQYQYQHQHTNDSSLQWDSLNTNATDHSGESPPSYEIALGVENASRPQSAGHSGNCSDREGETGT